MEELGGSFAQARTAPRLRTESSRSLKSFSPDIGSLTWRARTRRTRSPRGLRQRPAPAASQAICPSRCVKCWVAILIWDSEILDGKPPVTAQPSDPPIEHLLRQLTLQVLGIVVRRFRDFAAGEDAVQEASLAATIDWPRYGLPENPRAWLTQVAFRRMIDDIRSESARRRRESEAALEMDQLAPCGRRRSRIGSGRHAHPALHMLPPCIDSGFGDCPDVARGGWLDHGGDRPRCSCS
jgi:hypothetical protein